MRVVVLHNAVSADSAVDEQDVLTQRDAVMHALRALGHDATSLGCTLNLEDTRRELIDRRPDVVFNLVESLAGTDRLMPAATLLLDSLDIPYTGAHTGAILAVSGKTDAKQRLVQAGLPTPAWFDSRANDSSKTGEKSNPADTAEFPSRWILKPVWEHASIGMDDDAVVDVRNADALRSLCRQRERQFGRSYFAEQYIDGREFNLSMLAGQVLPAAEIDFSAFPPAKPRIVGHQAKWEQDSFEYQQTPRTFHFPDSDRPLLDALDRNACRCWELFGLNGFARVDFRVDESGRPWVLEVNVNPCLSPDAGFAAALEQNGIGFDTAVQRIIDQALLPGAATTAGDWPDNRAAGLFIPAGSTCRTAVGSDSRFGDAESPARSASTRGSGSR
ncbi:MAG: hypothetical protein R3C19_17755 [Planctomycetaceae bacterium]